MPSPAFTKILPPLISINSPCFPLYLLLLPLKAGELSYSEQLLGKCRWFCVVAGWQALWLKYILINQVCPKRGAYHLFTGALFHQPIFPFLSPTQLQQSTWVNSHVSWSIISSLLLETYPFFLFVPEYFSHAINPADIWFHWLGVWQLSDWGYLRKLLLRIRSNSVCS